ncbi:MAG: late competence development ComFB family protein [Oleiphilaceae bacterium]|nr:late competence development ComFB family protein [Oleiphilaceae bacterium]
MSLLDNITNYYEVLVVDALADLPVPDHYDEEVLSDIVCIALNHLPPRYIRHEVDMMYYTSPAEREELALKARKAVEDALRYMKENKRG